MKCTTCGYDNPGDAEFCGGCGKPLRVAQAGNGTGFVGMPRANSIFEKKRYQLLALSIGGWLLYFVFTWIMLSVTRRYNDLDSFGMASICRQLFFLAATGMLAYSVMQVIQPNDKILFISGCATEALLCVLLTIFSDAIARKLVEMGEIQFLLSAMIRVTSVFALIVSIAACVLGLTRKRKIFLFGIIVLGAAALLEIILLVILPRSGVSPQLCVGTTLALQPIFTLLPLALYSNREELNDDVLED